MKLQDLDNIEMVTLFLHKAGLSLGYLVLSGASWFTAQVLPEDLGHLKAFSALTGWGLAIACIWTLVKAVVILFRKLEEKDKTIAQLQETAVAKAEAQRTEMLGQQNAMLEELKALNRNASKNHQHSNP